MKVAVDELLTAADIARRLGVTAERVRQLAREREDFPVPAGVVGKSTVWRVADIDAWVSTWDRKSGRPKKEASGGAR